MQIEFLDARLKRLCEDRSARQRRWQKAAADMLDSRLDDLAAAVHLEQLRHAPGK